MSGAAALDHPALEALLRRRLHPEATCAPPHRSAVGNGQETWFVDAETPDGPRALVLRRSAADGALSWTDRAAEFAALAAVREAGLPVPAVLWLDEDGGPLERPYFVMERLPGAPPRTLAPEDRDRLSRALGAQLARLHALDAAGAAGALDRPATAGDAARAELGRWAARARAEQLGPMPLLEALLAWLERTAPDDPGPPSLLWGDPGPYNLLVHEGAISAMLDWELAHVGHPLDDLGAAQWACFDVLDPGELLAGYEAERGAPVDREALRWFRCLACVSRTVMLLAGNRAFAEGRLAGPSLASLGLDLVARNLARAAAEAGWTTTPPPELAPPPAGSAAQEALAPRLRPDAAELAEGLSRFVAADVLGAVEDRALRRNLKNAVGLLDTLAVRARLEPVLQAERAARARALLDELDLGDDLATAARRCELEPALAGARERMRAFLLEDLALGDQLLAPLRRMFGAG